MKKVRSRDGIELAEAMDRLAEMIRGLTEGEDVVLLSQGRPVAKLVPVAEEPKEAEVENDNASGRTWSPRDFDAPLPEDLTAALERCACFPLARAESDQ
jgi:antitoxin (DNA-binding transcriptional repressor) of toxin-antitoxin stability system